VYQGGGIFSLGSFTGEHIVELVPDGVAWVRIVYPDVPSVVEQVKENVFVLVPPQPAPRVQHELRRLRQHLSQEISEPQRNEAITQYDTVLARHVPTRIEWLNAQQRQIRVINATTAGNSKTSVGNLQTPIPG
jgi:hypothetical protein